MRALGIFCGKRDVVGLKEHKEYKLFKIGLKLRIIRHEIMEMHVHATKGFQHNNMLHKHCKVFYMFRCLRLRNCDIKFKKHTQKQKNPKKKVCQ